MPILVDKEAEENKILYLVRFEAITHLKPLNKLKDPSPVS